MKFNNKVSGVTVTSHPAEKCQNALAHSGKSWFDPERFNIIVKWMAVYYWRVRDGKLKEPERPIDN